MRFFNFFRKEKEPKSKITKSERRKAYGYHFLEPDDKLLKAMDKATEKHDTRSINGWLKSWAKEDLRDQRRWEKALKDTYGN